MSSFDSLLGFADIRQVGVRAGKAVNCVSTFAGNRFLKNRNDFVVRACNVKRKVAREVVTGKTLLSFAFPE
jgi:hypothetical protein